MQFSKSILIAAVAGLMPLASQATSIEKKHLSLTQDGLTFSKFSCEITDYGANINPGKCKTIQAETISGTESGLELSANFSAKKSKKEGPAFDNSEVRYRVKSATGISQIGLEFDGTYGGKGFGLSSVVETVKSGDDIVGIADLSCSMFGCLESATIDLGRSYKSLYIQDDITVAAVLGEATAKISEVDNTFTQAAATPEPSTVALMGAGLVAAAWLLRKRKKAAKARPQA